MNKSALTTVFLTVLMSLSTTSYAGNCSRDDVVFYLKQGFSHEQVTRICDSKQTGNPYQASTQGKLYQSISAPTPAGKTVTTNPVATNPATTHSNANMETIVFIKSAIQADDIQLTPSQLIISQQEDCLKYGTEDAVGFKDEACVQTRTVIDLAGLKIISAKKTIPFLGKREFIVAGNIQRQILNPNVLTAKQSKGLAEDYDLTPSELVIPMRSGIDPKQLERKLASLIR